MKTKSIKRKTLNNICIYFLLTVLMLIVIYNTTHMLAKAFNMEDTIFGFRYVIPETNSMSPLIEKNDLVFLTKVKEDNIRKGNIVAFYQDGVLKVNKIVDVDYTARSIITKAETSYYYNKLVTFEDIAYESGLIISGFGSVIHILQSVFVTIIILAIVLYLYISNVKKKQKSWERRKKKKLVITK